MNRTVKLLSAVVIVLIVVAVTQTYLLATTNHEAQAAPVRVACIGDSITRGTEYTLDLWAELGPDYVVGDFGVGGATVSLHSEAAYLNKTACITAEQFKPDIVVVMLGTNDADQTLNETTAEFVADYVTLLSAFQSLPNKPQVYIVQPPPIYNVSLSLSGELFAERVIPGIREVATQTGLPLIDAYSPLLGHPDLFIDGVHPTAGGAQLIANAVYAAVDWAAKAPEAAD
jgi:acyl-CoA thioesterase I